jgi:FLVCR family MFS transporter
MCVLVGFFINGTIPLYYELCCDACYPIAEGLTAASLITLNNLFCALFLVS